MSEETGSNANLGITIQDVSQTEPPPVNVEDPPLVAARVCDKAGFEEDAAAWRWVWCQVDELLQSTAPLHRRLTAFERAVQEALALAEQNSNAWTVETGARESMDRVIKATAEALIDIGKRVEELEQRVGDIWTTVLERYEPDEAEATEEWEEWVHRIRQLEQERDLAKQHTEQIAEAYGKLEQERDHWKGVAEGRIPLIRYWKDRAEMALPDAEPLARAMWYEDGPQRDDDEMRRIYRDKAQRILDRIREEQDDE